MEKMCCNCFSELNAGESVCPHCGYDQEKANGKYPLALPIGAVLNGRYILGRVLGQGGFGITYIAKDYLNGDIMAIKEYFPDTLVTRTDKYTVSYFSAQHSENFIYGKECFLNEAKTLAEFIGNPNIVKIYSYFEENNTAYYVMDYVRGVSLRDYLKSKGKISWEEAKKLLFPIMDALEVVHSRGIIHRDVTPDNIYICEDNTVKLLDFGAARYSLGDRSKSLDVVLKHGFAPREQYSRHGRQGPYTDVYSLAATYYYAITGILPSDSIDRQNNDDIIPPSSLGIDIPLQAEDALCKGLAVASSDRFQSMKEFKNALETGISAKDNINQDDDLINDDTSVKKKKRRKKAAIIGAPIVAVVVAFIIIFNTIIIPDMNYNRAESLMASGYYYEAMDAFEALGDYKDSSNKSEECYLRYLRELKMQPISAGYYHTVAIKADGTVVAVGDEENDKLNVNNWKDIVSVATGWDYTVGLKSDGTIVTAGTMSNGEGNVSGWEDIVAISAGAMTTVGLKADGTVLATGYNSYGQCDVDDWKDIVFISAEINNTAGVKSDGTVVVIGDNEYGQCNVDSWEDIVAVSVGFNHTVGLKSDGTVVAVGYDELGACDVEDWEDIVAVSAGVTHTVGLKADGTVVATGGHSDGQCDVEDWEDIVAISTRYAQTIGLKADGTVVATGSNEYGQCDVYNWRNIKLP